MNLLKESRALQRRDWLIWCFVLFLRVNIKNTKFGTPSVVQWLRTQLPIQEVKVWSPVGEEDSMCHGNAVSPKKFFKNVKLMVYSITMES